MKTKSFLQAMAGIITAIVVLGIKLPVLGQTQNKTALTGEVTSQTEGPMEGVIVTAKKKGGTISVSVVSDRQGHYGFPANRLDAGHYTLGIRAAGYDLDSPNEADISGQVTATVDIKLRETKNLASQLTNSDWLMSVPGTQEQKAFLMDCTDCHTVERIVRSTHNADEFTQVIARMRNYAAVSQPVRPQKRMVDRAGNPEEYRKIAEYLASINLSSDSQWKYPLRTHPRPSGRATRVIVTEYDLPRPATEPHDVILDKRGTVWYDDFGEQYIGQMDPKTGTVKEYSVPKPKPGFPVGSLDLEEAKDGTFWFSMMYQAAIGNFDPITEQFRVYSLDPPFNDRAAQVSFTGLPINGKVWATNLGQRDLLRLDLASGKYESFQPLKNLPGTGPYSIYGISWDSRNNAYFAEYQTNYIGRIDAETKEVTFYQTPTPHSRPRRMEMDSQDNLWFAEYLGNKVGLLETATKKITEWPLPTPWSGPYYVTRDKNGELWAGGMMIDRAVRLNPATGETVEYLMPKETNMRRVFVDNSTTPVTFWVGSNHAGSIVKVEPLD